MTSFYCTFCGTAITVASPDTKTALCSNCKALIPVPANAGVITAGPVAIANDAAPKPRGFPWVTLLFVIPFAIMWLGVVPILWVTSQKGAAVVSLLIGGVLGLFALARMRQRWTVGRFVWVALLVGFWGLACILVTREHQKLIATFGPVQTEFSGYVPPAPNGTAAPQPIKPKLFPLYLHSRGDEHVQVSAPWLPTAASDMDLYRHLPPALKALTAADVQTIVLLDWGWDATTHAGTCTVTLVDRKTRAVIASKVLSRPNPAPATPGALTDGPQPTNGEVIRYLQTLPIAAEQPDPAGR